MLRFLFLLVYICAFASASSAARFERDKAARTFERKMDRLDRREISQDQEAVEGSDLVSDEQSQDGGDEAGNSYREEGGETPQTDSNDQQANQFSIVLDAEVKELRQDMASVMLRLERMERKLKAQEEKLNQQKKKKTAVDKKTTHKKKKVAKPTSKKAKSRKS